MNEEIFWIGDFEYYALDRKKKDFVLKCKFKSFERRRRIESLLCSVFWGLKQTKIYKQDYRKGTELELIRRFDLLDNWH